MLHLSFQTLSIALQGGCFDDQCVAEATAAQRGNGLSQGSRLLDDKCRFEPGLSDSKVPCHDVVIQALQFVPKHVPKYGIMKTSAGVAHCRLRSVEEGDKLERWAGQSMGDLL